ncbi:MAG: hypothetical protein JXR64_01310 [Spirochaetales bacterium]|nr:hypothetical protein [Spirochaetales bacterium]
MKRLFFVFFFCILSIDVFSYSFNLSLNEVQDLLNYDIFLKAQAYGGDDYIVELSFVPNTNKVNLIYYKSTGISKGEMIFSIDKDLYIFKKTKEMPAFVLTVKDGVDVTSPAAISWNFSIVGIIPQLINSDINSK